MSETFGNLRQQEIACLAKGNDLAARLRLHVKNPPSMLRKQYGAPAMKKTHSATHKCGPATQECGTDSTVWAYLKQRFPENTEKRAAQELDVSHRTVERWRRRLPSGRHILLLITRCPDFVAFVTASKAEDEAAIDAVDLAPLEKGLGELSEEPDK